MNDNLPYQITAVLFDLDNTLLDRDASFRAWAEAFVQAHFSTEQNKAEIVQRIIALDNLCLMLKESLFAQVRQAYPSLQAPIEQLVTQFHLYKQLKTRYI